MGNINKPIGYWLKRADELLTEGIGRVQSSNGLSRLDWQILNTIRNKDNSHKEVIANALQSFADLDAVENALNKLLAKGVIAKTGMSAHILTENGEALFDRALKAQTKFREKVSKRISEEDYATTMRVLQQLVENLEKDNDV